MIPPYFQPIYPVPKWMSGQPLLVFLIAFALCTVLFGYPMQIRYATISILSVVIFYLGSQSMTHSWMFVREKTFLRNVFWVGLVVHLLWVAYCYFHFNMDYYGQIHGDDADTGWYMDFAKGIKDWFVGGFQKSFGDLRIEYGSAVDDCGYPIWLSIIYLFVGNWGDAGTVLIPMIIKCIVTTYSAILIYKVAKRHFDESVARMACVFVALNPNMIYWCGTMMKEPELVFLCCLFVNLMDEALSNNAKLTLRALLPAILVGLTFFLFRSVLGLIAFAATLAHIVMASQRIISTGKKVVAGLLVAIVLAVGMGEGLRTRVHETVDTIQSGQQRTNMEWRAERVDAGGRKNSFAKYATATVFAPLIFTLPFPTFNQANKGQILQQMLSGGSFIKNVMSYFVILVMVIFLISGQWRKHVFIIAFLCGYLAALVFSNFAQSGRFHMPVMPMLMMFGAYGISLVKQRHKFRTWYYMFLIAEVFICLFWNWFKLKGRGMI